MKRALVWAVVAALFLSGCSTPPEQTVPGPAPESEPTPPPHHTTTLTPTPLALAGIPGAPAVEVTGDGLLLRGLRQSPTWFASGNRLAVINGAGLWSLSADGQSMDLLAPAGPDRTVIGAYNDGLVYVERQPDSLVAFLVRPGQSPLQVAVVQKEAAGIPGYPFWGAVSGSRLVLAVEGSRAIAINLLNGKTADLGDESIPVWKGELALSPGGRYLAYKTANRGDEVRVLNLETGMVLRPSDDAHVPGVAWSDAGDLWAVRAAEPGSGLPMTVGANLEEGATHLDVGTVKGGLTHLTPPEPLNLVAGPWWSYDGTHLAVVSGGLPKEGEAVEPPHHLWVVTVAENRWRYLGQLPEGAAVGGFAPAELAVAVHTAERLALWPVSGDPPQTVKDPWALGQGSPARLLNGGLLYLSNEPKPRILYRKPNGEIVTLIQDESEKGPIHVGSTHAAVAIYQGGSVHDLLLFPLPR